MYPPPGAVSPVARRRHRRRWVFGAVVAVMVVVSTVLAWPGGLFCGGFRDPFASQYSAATYRSGEFVGSPQGPYSQAQVDQIASNSTYMFIPKFTDGFDIKSQFEQAAAFKKAAKADNHQVKVFVYISATFWFANNEKGWAPYSDSFKTSWLLKDKGGDPLPYYGNQPDARDRDPIGYAVDLTQQSYRDWVVQLAKSWTHDGPIDGIFFDNSDPLIGNQPLRQPIGDGTSTGNAVLCGGHAATDADGNCSRIAAWNQGMHDLLQSVTSALTPAGKEVIYNGVAPSKLRVDRNLALSSVTSGATNESFCYNLGITTKTKISLNPVADDLTMMKSFAQQGKKLFEITNFQSDARKSLGPYCLGSFLMGWQPGSSYFIYHQSYSVPATSWPVLPEQNLDLGLPLSDHVSTGGMLSRSFTHGFVVVNTGDKAATYTVPANGTRYSDGRSAGTVKKGDTVSLDPQTAAFFLTDASLPTYGTYLGVCR